MVICYHTGAVLISCDQALKSLGLSFSKMGTAHPNKFEIRNDKLSATIDNSQGITSWLSGRKKG